MVDFAFVITYIDVLSYENSNLDCGHYCWIVDITVGFQGFR
jgi:hypothetical protein